VKHAGGGGGGRERAGRDSGPERGGLLWWIPFGLAFAMLAAASAIALNALAMAAGARPGQDPLEVVHHVERGVGILEYSHRRPDLFRVAFLGDSTVTAYEWQHAVPNYLERGLERALEERPFDGEQAGKTAKVVSLAFPGMASVGYYFLADLIGSSNPDLIVWETSFTHVSTRWWQRNARPGLSGWADSGRLLAGWPLPLDELGISLDELLLYKALTASGGEPAWRALRTAQSRVGKWRRLLEKWIAEPKDVQPESRFAIRMGYEVAEKSHRPGIGLQRYNAQLEADHYGAALTSLDPQHPSLQMLRGGLEHFRDLGIPVVVYLNPINVDNLAAVEMLDEAAITRSVEIYRRAAEDSGAHFVDLHDLFPDRYFRDAPGHFTLDDEVNGPAELAEALIDPIRRAAGSSAP